MFGLPLNACHGPICISDSVDSPKMYLQNKFEGSVPFIYLESKLNAKREYFSQTLLSGDLLQVYLFIPSGITILELLLYCCFTSTVNI